VSHWSLITDYDVTIFIILSFLKYAEVFKIKTCNLATFAMYSEASLGLSSVPTVSAAFEYNDSASSGYFVSKIFAAFSKSWAADSGFPP